MWLTRNAFSEPAVKIPNGLSAAQYEAMGEDLKLKGWTEDARDALGRAIKADPKGAVGKKAAIYLRAYIPRNPVPQAAVQQNIAGFNQAAAGKTKQAMETFKACIKAYPTFEWPYSNLGGQYSLLGQYPQAETCFKQALAINPSYVNAWITLAGVYYKQNNIAACRNSLNKALAVDPDCEQAKRLLARFTSTKSR